MRIVVPDKINFTQEQLAELEVFSPIIFNDIPKSKQEIISRIENADIITANYIDIDQEVIDATPTLKFIIVPAVGYDWVDVKYAASKNVRVINCPTHNTTAVAEHAIALLFAAVRRIVSANGDLSQGAWEPSAFTGMEIAGKKLGIAGHGNIGKAIEKLAIGLGMHVTFINSRSTQEQIDALVSASDFIVVCAQLNTQTLHMIDARRLGLMKKEAYIINVARGGLIDQAALIKALESGKISGAGLDVFDGEPLAGKPSKEIIELAQLPNVVATPHIAYNTKEAERRLSVELVKNIKAILNSTPTNIVNP